MTDKCIKCNIELKSIDIGATKKFINRGAEEFMCLDCLAKYLGVPKEMILEKIELFKKEGCTLFV